MRMSVFLVDAHLTSLFFRVDSLRLKEQIVVSESECLTNLLLYLNGYSDKISLKTNMPGSKSCLFLIN